MKISNFSKTVHTIFLNKILHSYSTPKGAPACAVASKFFNRDWETLIFSKTVHTIRTKFSKVILHHVRVLCVRFHQNRMTGIRARQKEKDLSRLLYRICGSGFRKRTICIRNCCANYNIHWRENEADSFFKGFQLFKWWQIQRIN